MMAVSAWTSGSVTPPEPQVAGNEGYRQLWRGNTSAAVACFETALRSDSAFPWRWSDLGEAFVAENQMDSARYCFRRAIALAPRDPQIALRAANFSFMTGDVAQALRLDAAVLLRVPDYDGMIFSSYLRMGGDLQRELESGIGANPRAGGEFYRFLAARNDADADEAWRWLEGRGFVTRSLAMARTSWLLARNRAEEASAVWPRHVSDAGQPNRIFNAGFEDRWTGEGFDWRVERCAGVETDADDHMAHSGHRSLRVRFEAADNTDFHHVYQNVWLAAGGYRFGAWIRTADLSTDQGVALRIGSVSTQALTGSNDWTWVSARLEIGTSALVRVELVRRPSAMFNARQRGTAWIDDVELTPRSKEAEAGLR
jgi:hypothetical protein